MNRKPDRPQAPTHAHAQSRRPASIQSKDGDRVTVLELFFDLVFVFALHQVVGVVTHGVHPAESIAQAVVLLALVWWSWSSYAWLGNQARADVGVVRVGMILAMVLVFVVGLAVPEAFHDMDGGLSGPLVFVVAYLLIRLVHGAVYLLVARGDRGLQRQLALTLLIGLLPSAALLLVGAAADDDARLAWWAAAVVYDLAVVYITSRLARGWRVKSASHFAERHGLIVILALGESVIAIGIDAAKEPVALGIIVGAVLAIGLAAALWWAYFGGLADLVEESVAQRREDERYVVAVDTYTYLHPVLVAGILFLAVGIELSMPAIAEGHAIGGFAGWTLVAGFAVFLLTTVFLRARVTGTWAIARTVAAIAALALGPIISALPALAALAIVLVLVVLALIAERLLPETARTTA